MHAKVAWLLVGSYGGVVVALAGGTLLMPELFYEFPHRGISFWGNYYPAVVPYALGLLVAMFCLAMAAYYLPDTPGRLDVLRRLLWAIAIGLAAVLLTPEQAGTWFYWTHTLAAVYLFVVAGMGAAWAMSHPGKSTLDWVLLWMFVAGVVVSFLSASYVRVLGALAFGQIMAINAAMLIIVRAALRWSVQAAKE